MPSPIAHAAAAYAIAQAPPVARERARVRRALLVAVVGLSLLPDMDVLPGLLVGDPMGYHNGASHSLLAGGVVAVVVGGGMRLWRGGGFRIWAGLALACYALHILMDAATIGRGVMLFWPLSAERVQSPLILFYGLRHSHGLWSPLHLLTLATEGLFALVVVWGVRRWRRGGAPAA